MSYVRNPIETARRGAALVEAAIVIPLFFLLLFGLLEYGWAYLKTQEIHNAARVGVRSGIVFGAGASDVTTTVDSIMTENGLGDSGYTTTMTPSDPSTLASGELFQVQISVDYSNIELIGIPLIPVPSSLTETASMARPAPK